MATNTAASFTNHTGNGTAGPFSISFSYLSEAEVDVTVGGVLKTITTHYTFTSATQITFTSGNEPGNGVAIKFQRNTDVSSKAVDFVDGSVLTEIDLDNNANQLLFSMQEIVDSGAGSGVTSVTGTTPIVSSGGTTPAISISAATTSAAGSMSASDKSKLDGIEASATADQTASEIRTLVNNASDSNVFTDADHSKLDGIEASATADQTASEIKTAYESNSDTNAFTDAEKTKLTSVESNATADQTNAEIKTAYEANSDTNAFTDAEKTKLSGIETSADVTDATNVDAAGAVMNSDLDGKGELLVGDGSGDPTALSVGTNGYVLKANSSTATGLEWAAESGGGGGGEANQNAFSTIAVSGQSNVAADSATDTLNIAAGSNVTITTNAGSDTVTIASTDTNTTYSVGDGGLTQNNFTDALKTKLDGIEASATADQTASEIRTLVESASDSNVFTDADHTKLNAIEASATADQTDAEIKTAYENNSDTNAFTDSEKTKLSGIETSADVTDATNVASAGAVMDGDFTSNGFMKRTGAGSYTVDTNTYLTAVPSGYLQNVSEDSSPQLGANLDVQTNEITTSTSNGNIKLNPNGTGVVEIKGDGTSSGTVGTLQLNCSNNNHGVKIASPPHSAGASYTLTLPNTDGNANQVLKSDGSGGLDWVDQPTGNAYHSGEVTGSTTLTIADNVVDEANLKVSNSPTDGYVLTAQSGNTGGLTWAAQSGGGGGLSSDSGGNTVGGTNAGDSITTGLSNTMFGEDAGTAVTTAFSNTFIGKGTGKVTVDGQANTGIGKEAFEYLVSGDNNVAIGQTALGRLVSGNWNVGVGTFAGLKLTGTGNTALGYSALKGATGSNGQYNIGIGKDSGNDLSTGDYNIFIGHEAGKSTTTGSNSILIGRIAGDSLTTGSNNILIGYDATASSATVSNEITLGNSSISSLRCNVQTISSLSDRRDKTDINTLDLGLDFVKSLNPVKFKWETRDGNGKDGSYEAGFIAQDFQQLQKDNNADYLKLVMDENPDRLEASYGKLIPILVKAIQELTIEVETLKSNG